MTARARLSWPSWLPPWLTPALAVFGVAFFARLWVAFLATGTPEFVPQGDMKFYSDWAQRIDAGHWTDHQAFYGLPLYAYWLALVYKIVGYQPFIAILFQVAAEACTALLIFKLAPLAFARRGEPEEQARARWIGALAALGWILFPSAQAYSVVLMPTCYLLAAFWFNIWWVLREREGHPPAREFFLIGLLTGFVAMMVANILFLLPLLIAAIFWRKEWAEAKPFSLQARAASVALLLAGAALGASPCVFHNYVIAGEHVLFSAHSGINFYLGNNAQANGYPKIPLPLHADQKGMLQDSILWAERAVGHPLRRVEVSAFWSSLANKYIHEHPAEWLRLEVTKLGNFWNAFRYDDLGILTPMGEDGVLTPGAGFGLMATLALPGALLAFYRWPAARWIVFAVLLHMASVLTVFVTERYRLACVPGLLLLGSAGLVMLGQDLARSRWRPALAYAVVLVAALFLVWHPVDPSLRDVDELNSSIGDLEANRLDSAQHKLERLYHDHPDNAEIAFSLGNLRLARGDRDQAKALYRRALEIDPQHDRALNNLGTLAAQEKRWPLAEAFLSMSLRIEPDDAKADFLLAQVRRERNDLPGARQAIGAALHLRPEVPAFQQFSHQLDAQQ